MRRTCLPLTKLPGVNNENPKKIDYWGTGFKVVLLNFPCYENEGAYLPDVPLRALHKFVAYKVIDKPTLLTGNEFSFLRASVELNRSEAARKLGITRRTLINWEEQEDRFIKAPGIAQLGIRLLFFRWIFPGINQIDANHILVDATGSFPNITIHYKDFTLFGSSSPKFAS